MATNYTDLLSRLSGLNNFDNPVTAFRAARQLRQDQAAVSNYMNDPAGAIKQLGDIDPITGSQLAAQHAAQLKAQQDQADAVNAKKQGIASKLIALTRGSPDPAGTLAQQRDALVNSGQFSGDDIDNAIGLIKANPHLPLYQDDKVFEGAYQPKVVGQGGSVFTPALGENFHNPVAMKALPQGSAQTGFRISTFDPNSGAINGGPAAAQPVPTTPAPAAPAPAAPNAPADTFHRMVIAEGGTNPDGSFRTSPKGAVGPGQVLAATGPEAAAAAGLPWDPQRFASDPDYNRQIGEAYYAKQLVRFNGDPSKAAAAYNAGPGRIARLTGNGQATAFSKLPAETQAYVQKVAPGLFPGAPGTSTPTPVPASGGSVETIPAAPNAGKPTTRPATPQEIADRGLPPNTAAQIDSFGKLTVLGAKPGSKGSADPVTGYQNAVAALDEIDQNLADLDKDPHLSAATGLTGHVYQYTPGGADFHNKIKKINAQKLVGVAQQLQAGGNPFSRITNMEAQQLPNTLAALDTAQSEEGFRGQIASGRAQIAAAKARLLQQGQQQGILDDKGNPVARGQRSFPGAPPLGAVRKGHTYIGGDPAQPNSWRAN